MTTTATGSIQCCIAAAIAVAQPDPGKWQAEQLSTLLAESSSDSDCLPGQRLSWQPIGCCQFVLLFSLQMEYLLNHDIHYLIGAGSVTFKVTVEFIAKQTMTIH
jgi:hypothetical protein